VKSLTELKQAAIDAEAAWQEARGRILKRLGRGEALHDCDFCGHAVIERGVHPSGFWRCCCSPRVLQKAIRPAA
jgi:ribosomal protein L37AE/L43A